MDRAVAARLVDVRVAVAAAGEVIGDLARDREVGRDRGQPFQLTEAQEGVELGGADVEARVIESVELAEGVGAVLTPPVGTERLRNVARPAV